MEHQSITLHGSVPCPTPTGATEAGAAVVTVYHSASASVPRAVPTSVLVLPSMPPPPQQAEPLAQLALAAPAWRAEVFPLGAVRRRSYLKKQQPQLCRPPSAARWRAAARGTW